MARATIRAPMRTATQQLAVLLAITAAACGGGDDAGTIPDGAPIDAAVAPVFANPVDLPDDELAMVALQMLGANVEGADRNCNACHSITRSRLRSWEVLSDAAMANCIDVDVTDPAAALTMAACLRENPNDATTPFSAGVIGFYATAADLEWFTYLFDLAYAADGEPMHADFSGRVLMPRGDHPSFTQPEFDILAEWVSRDLVMLDDLLDDEIVTGDCTESISQAVLDHVDLMETTGWKSVNEAASLNMYGCAGATPVRDCMADQPLASTLSYGTSWAVDLPGSKLRVLRENNYRSAYWTRSSPDGRFVAHGGNDDSQDGNPSMTNYESTIIDLVDDHLIHTTALYDPGFFPDNSGWALQGSVARICPMSVLTAPGAPTNFLYSANSPPCVSSNQIGLYQHLGAALGGGDHWTIDGPFESDSGGHQTTIGDPEASFTSTSRVDFVPLEFDGTSYSVGTPVSYNTPNEGDTEMSPSTGLLISRVSGTGGVQNGFRLRKFVPTPDGGGGYTVTADEVGRLCFNGGKPGFSYDERWMAIHHYIEDSDAVDLGFTGPSDPGFQAYRSQGAANIYLVDLTTGEKTRITRMNPGQYALFPHFRNDGWIYFDVRNSGSSTEYIVASDAALLVSGL